MNISITVDVEKDLGSVDSFYGIDEGLPLILDILDRNNIKATFFISGEIVKYLEKNRFIEKIAKAKHEIASHGYHHWDYRNYTFNEVKYEISISRDILTNYSDEEIIGFRAPQFRIGEKIIKALKELNFKYDSSVPEPYSFSGASLLRNVKISYKEIENFEKNGIKEFQVSSVPLIRFPHGLLWVNLIGFNFYKFLFKKFKKEDLIIFYLHPFDMVKNKNRLKFPSIIEKSFYNIRSNQACETFKKILDLWKKNNVKIWRIRDYLDS